jgi:hypothetical protein
MKPFMIKALIASVAFAALPAAAQAAPMTITSFEAATSTTQAGAHPDATVAFEFSHHNVPDYNGMDVDTPDESVRNVVVDLPSGIVGDPTGIPTCSSHAAATYSCPASSQVGLMKLKLGIHDYGEDGWPGGGDDANFVEGQIPVYNVEPPPGQPARFRANLLTVNITIDVTVRDDGSYGLRNTISNISEAAPVLGTELTLWGVPADPSHDAMRFEGMKEPPTPAGVPPKPFMTNPSDCTPGDRTTSLKVETWTGSTITATDAQPAPTGCEKLTVEPTLKVTPGSQTADAPSGYEIELGVAPHDEPYGLAAPHLRKAVMTLPAGVSLSPSAGQGLEGCSDAQFAASSCPAGSKVGNGRIDSPVLPDPLLGGVYLASPTAAEPWRIFVITRAHGVTIKLTGHISPDPATGRLTTTFDGNPQLPFTRLRLQFDGGPRAPLSNPPGCGSFTAGISVQSYASDAAVPASSGFDITQACGGGFAPTFTAGSLSPVGGASSPFAVTFARGDGEQELKSVDMTLPPGLLGHVGRVPLCSDAAAAAGSCGAESQIGTVTVASGAGAAPLTLPGKAYLTGPYGGGPFGLVFVVPAKAGPVDLGLVVVRAAIHVDATDAHLRVVSDPLPRIVGGVPMRIRTVNVTLDRPGFMVNPTSCAPMQVAGTLGSQAGANAGVGTRFQVGSCSSLPLKPKLRLALTGRTANRDGRHPGLRARLTQGKGQSGLKQVSVALPLSVALEPNNAEALCEPSAAATASCPENTVVGRATATTPLLDQPLSGNVYFVRGERRTKTGQVRRTLPKLLLALRGQIALNVMADSAVRGGALVTTFPAVPDAPISRFDLTIDGGEHGILAANTNTCTAPKRADLAYRGHNGKRRLATTKVTVAGCKK